MPFITLTGGITLKVPTRSTTDWDTEFLNEFATPISTHQHTGTGDGLQLGGGSIQDDSLDDRKLRLRNNQAFRSRNAAGTGEIDLIKADASDQVSISSEVVLPGLKTKTAFSFANNQAVAADVTGIQAVIGTDNALRVKYSIKRIGTASLFEHGEIEINYNGTSFDCIQEYSGNDSGVDFSVDGTGQLQYTSSDNTGSSLEKMYLLTERFGD